MQARDRRLLGLIEALRLVPLRNPAEDSAWSAAAEQASPQPEAAARGPPSLNDRSTAKAVWALAMLGGPVLFQSEMEAALKVRPEPALWAMIWRVLGCSGQGFYLCNTVFSNGFQCPGPPSNCLVICTWVCR